MNTIYLKDVLKLTREELQRARIELNQTAGRGGEWFIDRWLKTDRQLRCDGRTECSYWGWYGDKRNFYPGDIVFSFVRTNGDEWLFVSAARITDVPDNSRAEYEVLDAYKGFFGRLTILYHKGQKFGRYVFRMKDIANKAVVKEISPDMYDGKKFSGYDNVRLSYSDLETIVRLRPGDWVNALENQKAVYLITDCANGKLYVGSATADSGMLLARWESYVKNGHGGNAELKAIVENKGLDYVKDNFQYSVLENYNARVGDEYVLKREKYWKDVLQTVRRGYNKNY